MAEKALPFHVSEELRQLALLADEDIDTSEIPETLNWTQAQRGRLSKTKLQRRDYDVRSLANWLLDHARARGIALTNLALNKIIYFANERSLVERMILLTPAKMEAWSHGPVFREVFQAFKRFQDLPITEKATRFSADRRLFEPASEELREDDREFLEIVFQSYGRLSASQLRNLSHRVGGPWHTVWHHRGKTNPGMEISPIVIFNYAQRGIAVRD